MMHPQMESRGKPHSGQRATPLGIKERLERDLRGNPRTGHVDLEASGSQVSSADSRLTLDVCNATCRAQGVAERANPDNADRLVIPEDRLGSVEVEVGRLKQNVHEPLGERSPLFLLEQRLAADEAAGLVPRNSKAQPCLQRG